MWEDPQAGYRRAKQSRGKIAWFWLGFICATLPPVHMHYHGDFEGDEQFCYYLQDFCFMQGTHSGGRCSENISTALFIMIDVSWCQEQPNIIIAAVGCCRSSGSSLISETNFFVMLNKSCQVSHLLRERQQYSSTSQRQVEAELYSILLQTCICPQLDNYKINSSLNSMLRERKLHGLCFNTSLHSHRGVLINLQSPWPLTAGSLIHQLSQLPSSAARKKGEQIIYMFIIYLTSTRF